MATHHLWPAACAAHRLASNRVVVPIAQRLPLPAAAAASRAAAAGSRGVIAGRGVIAASNRPPAFLPAPFGQVSRRPVSSWHLRGSPWRVMASAPGGEDAPLAAQRCVPCEGKGLLPLAPDRVQEMLAQVPGWEAVEEGGMPRIRRRWRSKSFTAGLAFFQRVGELAEAEGHHPDLHLEGWNNVRIDIYTHAIGGLHSNDFVLAAKINELPVEDLMRKPKTKLAHHPPA